MSLIPIKNVLISVSDKRGLDSLVSCLNSFKARFFSTGGTAKYLRETCGLEVISVEDLTQFPEMMHGRVKTLHPKVFGGILARRNEREDMDACEQHGIPLFDLVVVNLYPFWEHRNKSMEDQVEFVDIGGPSLLRAAAKNHAYTSVLSDASDYKSFIDEINQNQGSVSFDFRKNLAAKTFLRTSQYDSDIANQWLKKEFPVSISLEPQRPLRYGENPHQKAVWCGPEQPAWRYLQGKELSYNNLLDTEAAVALVQEFSEPACAIIKHNNPCGIATGANAKEAFEKALSCDPTSAFGGIVAFNCDIDLGVAELLSKIFLEVVVGPYLSPDAMGVFQSKKNLRVIEWEHPSFIPMDVRPAMGGWLVQQRDLESQDQWNVVTHANVPAELEADLKFAWKVVKHVKSNAIVIAEKGLALGVGAGQMSRIDSLKIALEKCKSRTQTAVLASDAFFPFRDNIDLLKNSSIKAIIQPGGSIKDSEVIEACNEHGIAMVFTGVRHFRH